MAQPIHNMLYHAASGTTFEPARRAALAAVEAEVKRSYIVHGIPLWGRHEAWAIIKEELDEVWDAVKADDPPESLLKELIQTAAMCIRYIETDIHMQAAVLKTHTPTKE